MKEGPVWSTLTETTDHVGNHVKIETISTKESVRAYHSVMVSTDDVLIFHREDVPKLRVLIAALKAAQAGLER